jgi:hypothetical protein
MPTIFRTVSGVSGVSGGPTRPSAAEQAFFDRDDVYEWWEGKDRQGLARATPIWKGRKRDTILAPIVSGQLPDVVLATGPASSTVVRGKGGDPAGGLITPAGTVVIPNGEDWTIFGVTNSGSSATAVAAGVAGANGGALDIVHRTSNLFNVRTYSSLDAPTTRNSAAVTSGAYVLWTVAHKQSTGAIETWVNGAMVATVAAITLLTHAQRLTVLAKWDSTTGLLTPSGRTLPIALLGVANVYAPDSTAFRAALKAMVNAIYPSITVA